MISVAQQNLEDEISDKPTMKITAISPWFGGKRNLAPKIIELLGPHKVYWEPFCGSMAVLLAKEPCVMETVNDLHGDLINLARVLQNEELAIKLYGRISRTIAGEQVHKESTERYLARLGNVASDEPCLDAAYDYLIYSWLGRNGMIGTSSYSHGFCVRYTNNGGKPAQRWRAVTDSIPAWHWRLRNVFILNRDAFEIIGKIHDTEETALYIDPPYLVKGAKYIHDFEPDDHQRLATALSQFKKARVVVSYYEHPLLDELYPNWRRHRIDVSKSITSANKRESGKVSAVEVLLTNEKRGLFNG